MRWILSMVAMVVMLTVAVPVLKQLQVLSSGLGAPRDEAISTPQRSATGDARPPVTVRVPTSATVYRWRDAEGTIHIESRPPPDGVEAETIVLEGTKLVPVAPAGDPGRSGAPSRDRLADQPFSVYQPEGSEELMRRLGETLESLDERRRAVDDLHKDL